MLSVRHVFCTAACLHALHACDGLNEQPILNRLSGFHSCACLWLPFLLQQHATQQHCICMSRISTLPTLTLRIRRMWIASGSRKASSGGQAKLLALSSTATQCSVSASQLLLATSRASKVSVTGGYSNLKPQLRIQQQLHLWSKCTACLCVEVAGMGMQGEARR